MRDDPDGPGDCFKVAADLMLREYGNDETATLVHGLVLGQGRIAGVRHWHAWVEISQTIVHPTYPDHPFVIESVVDKSNGNDVMLPKALYYSIGHIERTVRYDHHEARLRMLHSLHYGPWEDDDDAAT